MRYLSLFSGIEAASVAWLPLGWECVGVAEIEKFPCAVLAHHYPDVPNLGDITKITQEQIAALGHIDLVVGGFPCQDLSVAGKRAGLTNDNDGSATRSGLFFAAMRVVGWTRARWTVIENVPGLFSSKGGADFASVVGALAGCEFGVPDKGWGKIGAAAGPDGLVEWCVLDAQWFGVPQRRRRVFLVRDSGDWYCRPPVLFERHSLQGNPPPSREKGENLAPTISARTKGGGGLGTDFDCDGGLVASFWNGEQVYQTLDAVLAKGQMMPEKNRFPAVLVPGSGSYLPTNAHHAMPVENPSVAHAECTMQTVPAQGQHKTTNMNIASEVMPSLRGEGFAPDTAHSLRGEGFDASEDRARRGTPLVPIAIRTAHTASNGCGINVSGTSYTVDRTNGQAIAFDCKASGQNGFGVGEIGSTMRGVGHGGGHQAIAVALRGREGGGTAELSEIPSALRASGGGGDKAHVLVQTNTCYTKGINRGDKHASAQEANTRTLLSRVQKEIGTQAFAEWGFGILDSLQATEILQSALHGLELRPAAFTRSWVVYCALSRKEDRATGAMLSLLEACGERCPPQGWEPLEQLSGELGAYLSELSQPGAQAEKFMCALWAADEGSGVLQQALSAIQKTWRPDEDRIPHSSRMQNGWMRGDEPCRGTVQQACTTEAPWDAGQTANEPQRAGEKTMAGEGFQIRRLTPLCCEFLQGFPRGYTNIPFTHGKPAADGPRYKALGNSMAVPCMRYIGERIQLVDWLYANN